MKMIIPVVLLATSAHANPIETRCGWFSNPTPANYGIADALGYFELAAQGGPGADGFYDALDVAKGPRDWVAVNGSYGYGCACARGLFDVPQRKALRIDSVILLPLARCEADPALPENIFGD